MAVAIAVASAVIGGVMGAIQMQQQAAMYRMNAQIETQNAKRAVEYAALDAQEADFQARARIGEAIAAQASSGVSVETGSPLAVRQTARRLSRLDALNIKQSGELKAYNHRVAAANYNAQAQVAEVQGAGQLLGGFLSAAGSIAGAPSTPQKQTYNPVNVPKGILY
ncbi:MAG: hypothetical protein KDA17_01015 [Candidatus Saccharibacteria bacterium]|nr:hypothetical protein [Candidatus Saccharibacteria bacterium]